MTSNQIELTHELGTNFINYAMAVNTDRSIPDATTGLKPVHKRILYCALDDGLTSNKKHVKCANIVGSMLAKWHPHGDSSVYEALVRLSQPWVMRYPLIDFHGNQGNQCGDGPAAYRYTECRLAKISEDGMLAGVKKHCVDFQPNFDETRDEPINLPAIFPNLLCNPNSGIGVAMACSWAPHNLNEVATAINDYLSGKEPMLLGPDFPTGGTILNKDDIPKIMVSGKGSVRIRAKYTHEGNDIIFYEIPYGVTVEKIMQELNELSDVEGALDGVTAIRDETTKKSVRIVLKCKKDANQSKILSRVFSDTSLQSSFSYNQVALVNGEPKLLNLKDCIEIYVNHNIDCITKEYSFDLAKAQARLHIVEGLLKALEDIDNIVALIRSSKSAATAKVALQDKYNFSEEQAKAIVDMKLGKLAGLERIEIENDKKDLLSQIEGYNAILADVKAELRKRLQALVTRYGDARRTEITQIAETKEEKEIAFVEPEKCVVVLMENGNIKRIPATSFRTQRRNGKGVKTQADITSMVLRTNTIDSLMIFSDKGKMYRLLVDNIPVGTNVSAGTPIKGLVEMEPQENPTVIYSIYRDTDAKYVLFVTKNGLVKKTSLDEYIKTKKKTGIGAIGLKEGDELVSVSLIKDEPIILLTKNGMGIKFNSSEIGTTSRTAGGVKGINLNEEDEVVTALPVRDEKDYLAIFSKNGLAKKFASSELPLQKRSGKGLICHKSEIAAAALVSDEDNLLICGDISSICIAAKDITVGARPALGTIVIKDNNIISVSKV